MNHLSRLAVATVVASTFGATVSVRGQAVDATASRADVPVKSVMLFSSGVGFFEHAGNVRGNGSTELRFKTAQINDILKSLVLQDEGGGRVSAITYPSQDPVEKTLRSFQVDITSNPSLADLLNQLRGARITIQSRLERISGAVLGVESRQQVAANEKATSTPVLNLLTGATIRAVELPTISSLQLDDIKLQDELTKALTALSQARDKDKKPVTINFVGNGDRRVRIGYVVESPIWKTSYRLLLDEKVNRLQGWAIVENQTESDWTDVSLSLVSGRPMSFMMDLYRPLYLTRPTVTQQLFSGLSPRAYNAGLSLSTSVSSMSEDFAGSGVRGGTASGVVDGPAPVVGRVAGTSIASPQVRATAMLDQAYLEANYGNSVQSNAAGRAMGELFQYAVGNVTLARQKSAMLPIITDTISIDRLSIYNADVLATNPLNGVRLRNTSGQHLLEGPVTVLDGNKYAGDARINSVPPGQDRLLSYGIDLDVVVQSVPSNAKHSVVTGHIEKGVLFLSRKSVESREYRAENKSDKDNTLLIEHPSRASVGYKLVDTQKPVEITDTHYRFQGLAAARKTTVLKVTEENIQMQSLQMLSVDVGSLLAYTTNGEIPPAVRSAIERAIELKRAVLETERALLDRGKRASDITTEQTRIRENMKTVAQNSPYYQRLLQKLNDQESQLEKLGVEREDLTETRDRQRRELEVYLSGLIVK